MIEGKSSTGSIHNKRGTSRKLRITNNVDTIQKLSQLPLIADLTVAQQPALVVKKLKYCQHIFDFCDPVKQVKCIEIKTGALNELIDHFNTMEGEIVESIYSAVIKMVSKNIFRVLPPSENCNFDPEEDEPLRLVSWPHLQLVYELFFSFLDSPDFQSSIGEKFLDESFVLNLLNLFHSGDPRERDYLKSVLHLIYSIFMNLRAFIRKNINNMFLEYVYETNSLNGVGELLEILSHVITGFTLPLKQEHKVFLMRVLLPLHKPKSLSFYYSQLANCVIQFITKDYSLTQQVFNELLRFWPKTCSRKELIFLEEIEKILSIIEPKQFKQIVDPLFRQLAKCVSSQHFQVADKALFFWNNDHIMSLIEDTSRLVMPILIPALYRVSELHWNYETVTSVQKVLRSFMKMDKTLFDELLSKYNSETQREKKNEKTSEEFWKIMDQLELNPPEEGHEVNPSIFPENLLAYVKKNRGHNIIGRKEASNKQDDNNTERRMNEEGIQSQLSLTNHCKKVDFLLSVVHHFSRRKVRHVFFDLDGKKTDYFGVVERVHRFKNGPEMVVMKYENETVSHSLTLEEFESGTSSGDITFLT